MDRNRLKILKMSIIPKSLSARRAWIEIGKSTTLTRIAYVALRKESVDRNYHRRRKYLEDVAVALRKESVDRNRGGNTHANRYYSRSPQGERG